MNSRQKWCVTSFSVLDKTKFKKTFGIKIPYWTDSLKKCIKNLKEENYEA